MNGETRRTEIIKILSESTAPISASALASQFGVSRQIIVGDISLIRASGREIISTPRGYVTPDEGDITPLKTIVCLHSGEDMEDELNIMVDNGCTVVNVIVDHPVYGQLEGKLQLRTRYDVRQFVEDISEKDAPPLSSLTGGIHIHTLKCPSEDAYNRTVQELTAKGYIYEL